MLLASVLFGALFGLGVRYVDSLPPDVAYLGGLAKAVFFVVGFVAVMIGIGQLTTGRRTVLLAAGPALLAWFVTYPLGPSAVPAVAVGGDVRLTIAGEVAETDTASCTWAAGRERIGLVESSGRRASGATYALEVNLGDLTITLRTQGGRYVARGTEAFAGLTGDSASVSIERVLVQIDPSAPAELVPALTGAITWRCDPPP